MRKLLFFWLGIVLSSAVSFAQFIEQPASWEYNVIPVKHNEFEIRFTASLKEPWHMYDLGPYENGPHPTRFLFDLPNGVFLVEGIRMESPPAKEYDPLFGMDIGSFGERVCLFKKSDRKSLSQPYMLLSNGRFVTEVPVCRLKRNRLR